ncbi:hypothetical protein [Dapis sp. BLCC M172]|uniref:hypothetical protein n=1 Tax=Dapis sp. BLCC M172 TaxID=2975281 RepID=UPI003CF91F3B
MGKWGSVERWGDGEMGEWGVLDISQHPIIKSIITHFLSIPSPDNLFSGDTVRASISLNDKSFQILDRVALV